MTEEHSIAMVRPKWNHQEHFLEQWRKKDITVLVCQRKTKDLIQLSLESLLRWYPDIPILLVDGDSQDESSVYCRWMSLKHPNITLWERVNSLKTEHSSHGETLHDAVMKHITTKYVLIMDSDTITERSGWIEGMLEQMNNNQNMFATGTLMLVSNSNDGAGAPNDNNDILRYSHPSCSLMRADLYKSLDAPFLNHGSPSYFTMRVAQQNGYSVGFYPVDEYVSHLSGASWCVPRTIWNHDHDVFIRPFITFINDGVSPTLTGTLNAQTSKDFDIVTRSVERKVHHVVHHIESVGKQTEYHPTDALYAIRFKVCGEYICDLSSALALPYTFVDDAIKMCVEQGAPDLFQCHGLSLVKRYMWQQNICLNA